MSAQEGVCCVVAFPHSAECKGCGKSFKKRSRFHLYCNRCNKKVSRTPRFGCGTFTRRHSCPDEEIK